MHSRKQIMVNQAQFRDEIVAWIKNDFKDLKRQILSIKPIDPEIEAGKSSLVTKSKNININVEISKFFISPKNLYPEFYAWWDEQNEEVRRIKYIDDI